MSRDIERSVRKERAVRRERIATAVLAGLHANPSTATERPHALAERAVEAADALLDHLTAAKAREELHALKQSRTAESEVTA